jgi:hypothetical protein
MLFWFLRQLLLLCLYELTTYSEDRDLIDWIAFIAALSTGPLTGLDIGSKSNRAREAWLNPIQS